MIPFSIAVALTIHIATQDATTSRPAKRVLIHAVRVSDDDGGRPCPIEPDQFARWVHYANRVYKKAHLRFDFDPDSEWSELQSTLLNNMTGTGDANWPDAKAAGNDHAARHPGRLVVFLRHGPGPTPTGGGFSWFDYDFVAAPGFDVTTVCGRQNIHLLAHEIGHYFALPHTFAREFATTAEADAFLARNGGKPDVFDGDGFDDSPADPFIRDVQCGDHTYVTLGGMRVNIPRNNVMSYWHGEPDTNLTPQQAARVRWAYELRRKNLMKAPTNAGLNRPLEAELFSLADARNAAASPQEMDPFGVGNWSGGKQMFCRFDDGGVLTFRFKPRAAGSYRLDFHGTMAPDFGRFRLSVVGADAKSVFDAFAPLVIASGPVTVGFPSLENREYEFRIELLGKDARSTGTLLGFDCLALHEHAPASR